jgi:hypothetical protein
MLQAAALELQVSQLQSQMRAAESSRQHTSTAEYTRMEQTVARLEQVSFHHLPRLISVLQPHYSLLERLSSSSSSGSSGSYRAIGSLHAAACSCMHNAASLTSDISVVVAAAAV